MATAQATAARSWITLAVCGLLVLAVFAAIGQTAAYDFINLDDDLYVYDNPHVTAGLTLEGLDWAFLHPRHVDYWRPLGFLSHMLDWQVFGRWPGGHHLTNVVLHAAAAAVLFLALRAMTGRTWPSALVAAVFAVHPLRVESVAWVTERKDVLAALFFALTLGAYAGYARRPGLGRYVAVFVLYALGLMCKPTLAPLPLVFLLLDYWPLGRAGVLAKTAVSPEQRSAGPRGRWALAAEKIPLLALGGASGLLTLWTATDILRAGGDTPLWTRAGRALDGLPACVGRLFWPVGLAPWYPNPPGRPAIWPAALALVVISAAVIALRRRQPWLLAGWFWWLLMVLPSFSMTRPVTDRFSYLSQIGLCLGLTFSAAEWAARRRGRRAALGLTAVAVAAALCIAAHAQCAHWRDSETLWTYTLRSTAPDSLAHNNLGAVLAGHGQLEEAIDHYRQAVEIDPGFADAHSNLGQALIRQGRLDEAIDHCRQAVEIEPHFAKAHYNLGLALDRQGKADAAIDEYQQALAIEPRFADAYNNLGGTLAGQGRTDEAIDQFEQVLAIDPGSAAAHNNLGNLLAGRGKFDAAIEHYRKALVIQPGNADACCNFGAALAARGDVDAAIEEYQRALQIDPRFTAAHVNLGNALASRGKLDAAIDHYRQAVVIDPAHTKARCCLGIALAGRGEMGAAIEQFQKAVEIDPRFAEAHNNLGGALARLGRLDEAIGHYREALEIQPDNLEARDNLGMALAGRGEISAAIEECQKALDLAVARKNTAVAEAIRGQIQELRAAGGK